MAVVVSDVVVVFVVVFAAAAAAEKDDTDEQPRWMRCRQWVHYPRRRHRFFIEIREYRSRLWLCCGGGLVLRLIRRHRDGFGEGHVHARRNHRCRLRSFLLVLLLCNRSGGTCSCFFLLGFIRSRMIIIGSTIALDAIRIFSFFFIIVDILLPFMHG